METKRILIVNVNWVGDVVFSTPFIRALREAYPKSFIACLIHPRCAAVLEGNPCLDEIIVYDEEGIHRSLVGKGRLILELAAKHFDTAFLLHRSFTKALIAFLAGIGERIGYPSKRRGVLLTKVVEEPAEEVHKVEHFLAIARSVGITPHDISYEFHLRDTDRAAVRDLLAKEGITGDTRLVVFCPGGNWDPKRWPRENFARLGDMLAERYGVRIAIAGAAKDTGLAEEVRRLMRHAPVITCGKTSLKGLGALLERASLVVANDTGPMHIAVAVKTKVIALFGPTSPRLTGPYGAGTYTVLSRHESCDIPCYDFSCSDNRCMKAITVDDVFRETERMLIGAGR